MSVTVLPYFIQDHDDSFLQYILYRTATYSCQITEYQPILFLVMCDMEQVLCMLKHWTPIPTMWSLTRMVSNKKNSWVKHIIWWAIEINIRGHCCKKGLWHCVMNDKPWSQQAALNMFLTGHAVLIKQFKLRQSSGHSTELLILSALFTKK